MNKTIQKLLGILLALIGFVFLIWVFLAHPSTLVVRLLLNMIGFFGFAGGLLLAGINLFGWAKPKEPYERKETAKPHKKKETEKVELKEFKEEDHDKYKPKG